MIRGQGDAALIVVPFDRTTASVYLVSLPLQYCGIILAAIAYYTQNDQLLTVGLMLVITSALTLWGLALHLRKNFPTSRSRLRVTGYQKAWYALFFGLLVSEAVQTMRATDRIVRRVDYAVLGATLLGFPALLVAIVGGLILLEFTDRRSVGQELVTSGVETVAESVEVDIVPARGSPFVDEVRVVFRTDDGREVRTALADHEEDRQGMPEGTQRPARGTRYATPLKVVYRPSDPSVALASVDARQWVADRATPRVGTGMVVGGLAVSAIAILLLSRNARSRGLAWWQWYAAAPASHG